MRALLLPLTAAFLLLPLRGEAATLRCGNQLASEGSSRSDVLMRCGDPMSIETRRETVGEQTNTQNKQGGTRTTHTVEKTTEEWTYNFGPHRLMQVAVFENGRLVDVRSGGYGR